jgi:hypothetical protein
MIANLKRMLSGKHTLKDKVDLMVDQQEDSSNNLL